MKNINYQKSLPYFFAAFFLLSVNIYSQGLTPDDLKKIDSMTSGDKSSGVGPTGKKSSFQSVTQNRFSNIAAQLTQVDEYVKKKAVSIEAYEAKLDLALNLCKLDQKACYLIEEFKKYDDAKIPVSFEELELFGVNLFTGYPLSFDQSSSVAPAGDYIIMPGDELVVNLYGPVSSSSQLQVGYDGNASLQGYGNLQLAGKTLDTASKEIELLIQIKDVGVSSSLSLSSINTSQIYSLGAVRNPGLYNLNSVSKSINAIIAGGGFSNNASLRNIEIKRNSQTIATVDLYDFLFSGITSADQQLRNNDAVVVSSATSIVSIMGEVNRPAKYEVIPGETLEDLLFFALGYTEHANQENISIERRNRFGQYETLTFSSNQNPPLVSGDRIFVGALKPDFLNFIQITGSIRGAGKHEFKTGMNLGDLINISHDLAEDTYIAYAVLAKFQQESRSYSISHFDLISQLSLEKISLNPRDKVFIFSHQDVALLNSEFLIYHLEHDLFSPNVLSDELGADGGQTITRNSLIDESVGFSNLICLSELLSFGGAEFIQSSKLKLKTLDNPKNVVCTDFLNKNPNLVPLLLNASVPILGNAVKPGLYPLSRNIDVQLAVAIAGGDSNPQNPSKLVFESYDNQLNGLDIEQRNLKYVSLVNDSTQRNESYVTLAGEFQYPGTYKIDKFTTISEIYKKAGGLTSYAYPLGGVLSRESIKLSEAKALSRAEVELNEILASAVISGVVQQSANDLMALQGLMNQISDAKPIGRLVAELDPRIIDKSPTQDIKLEAGDVIYMPQRSNVVTVVGSVLNPVTVPYQPGLSLKEYIDAAGGYKSTADEKRSYYVLPNGRSFAQKASLFGLMKQDILPGTTIIVPRKARPLSGFSLVETITPVLANLSITAASIASVSRN